LLFAICTVQTPTSWIYFERNTLKFWPVGEGVEKKGLSA